MNAIICFAFRYFQAIETEIQKLVTFLTHRLLPASSGFIPRLGKVSSHCEWRFMDAERVRTMVGEMVQNSQSLYSFTFNALIDIHEYIYLHPTTEFTFKKYIYSHLPVYFLFTIIFAHINEMSSFTFNKLYPFTSHSRSKYSFNIFCAPPLRISQCKTWTADYRLRTTDWI